MKNPAANDGYYQFPTIHADLVAFVCEGALWTAPAEGGTARRLTDHPGEVSFPRFSPDGRSIAYTSTREGTANVYLIPAEGGPAKRLTFHNFPTAVAGWTPSGREVVFRSAMASPTPREPRLFTVSTLTGEVRELPVGPAVTVDIHRDGRRVAIGRHSLDPARWKRYRGGTCGVLWTGDLGRGGFRSLRNLGGNAVSPMWIKDRVFFLSDHEDYGNIYSCTAAGTDLKRHTHHKDFYARFPSTDGRSVVYQAGAEIRLLRPDRGTDRRIEIRVGSDKPGLSRKFVPASSYMTAFELDPSGKSLLVTSRGKLFHLPNWEGSVRQIGVRQGVRYRLAEHLHDGKRVVTVSDEGGEESFEIRDLKTGARLEVIEKGGIGYPWELRASPVDDKIVVADDHYRLFLCDLKRGRADLIDRSEVREIGDAAWSPDGRYVAYVRAERVSGEANFCSSIRVYDLKKKTIHDVTGAEFINVSPSFDPEGKFLAFLSYRSFNPVLDSVELNSSFPKAVRPYIATLKAKEYSPLFPMPVEEPPKKKEGKKKKKKDAEKPVPLEIEFEGIRDRIEQVPVVAGDYWNLNAVKGKILYQSRRVAGMLDAPTGSDDALHSFDVAKRKHETLYSGITFYNLSAKGEKTAVRVGPRLRVFKAGDKPPSDDADAGPHQDNGWIDLDRIRLEIEPRKEWEQIYLQAWRDQRDFFWTKDLSGVKWTAVRDRYRRLLDKVATRGELSDLIWDMQGELGTSHAYEFGGDYDPAPYYGIGLLGADLALDRKSGRYRFSRIYRGDLWKDGHGSPLLSSGVNVRAGDFLFAIDGREIAPTEHPLSLLADRADRKVVLKVGATPDPKKAREVTIKALDNEFPARYRDWVRGNRERVRKASGGKLGYLHIPDMGAAGLVEFHRGLYAESSRQGLIVDVRFNGGGFVSGIILSKLARRPIAYCSRRIGTPSVYPDFAIQGPLVALCDERAGSDGDIFAHSFKALGLGPLIGKRTWGGVIGINSARRFVDEGLATQPEFAFWFHDKGWEIENHGVDPDIEVEFDPDSHRAGRDPQLEKAIEAALKGMKDHPHAPKVPGPGPSKAPRPLPGAGRAAIKKTKRRKK